jgi:hypothetical protein
MEPKSKVWRCLQTLRAPIFQHGKDEVIRSIMNARDAKLLAVICLMLVTNYLTNQYSTRMAELKCAHEVEPSHEIPTMCATTEQGDAFIPCRVVSTVSKDSSRLIAIPIERWTANTELLMCVNLYTGETKWCHSANRGGPSIETGSLYEVRIGMWDCADNNFCGFWRFRRWIFSLLPAERMNWGVPIEDPVVLGYKRK